MEKKPNNNFIFLAHPFMAHSLPNVKRRKRSTAQPVCRCQPFPFPSGRSPARPSSSLHLHSRQLPEQFVPVRFLPFPHAFALTDNCFSKRSCRHFGCCSPRQQSPRVETTHNERERDINAIKSRQRSGGNTPASVAAATAAACSSIILVVPCRSLPFGFPWCFVCFNIFNSKHHRLFVSGHFCFYTGFSLLALFD